jgi:hypothetical protein
MCGIHLVPTYLIIIYKNRRSKEKKKRRNNFTLAKYGRGGRGEDESDDKRLRTEAIY